MADLSGLKRNNLESLIKAGALDDFGDRGALLAVVDRILGLAQSEAGLKDSDQTSMFDLFGDSVPTPLANVALPEVNTPSRDKETWERELLGLSLSTVNSLASLLSSADGDTIKFRDDVTEQMAGATVSLVGQVSSVTQRFTRQNRPFLIASLSLMDGMIEVFVWEEQMEANRGLWEEGKIVAVVGTVRLRGDQVSVSCSRANEYAPDAEGVPAQAQVDRAPADVSSDSPTAPTGAEATGLAGQPTPPAANGPSSMPSASPALAHTEMAVAHRLNLKMRESDDAEADRMLLDDVKRMLLDHDGQDEVTLEIEAQDRVYMLEWPMVKVDASEDLMDHLHRLLGESGHATVESPRI